MNNQKENHRFPKRNWVENLPAVAITNKINKDISISDIFGYFIRIWLPIIGVQCAFKPEFKCKLVIQKYTLNRPTI